MYPSESYRRAIARIESGGRYDALGPWTKDDRPYGKYQIMGRNIGPWTEQALGERMSPDQFLANPQAQDATFDNRFGGYVNQYGPEGAAQAWIGGPGSVGQTGRKDVLGTSVGSYGQQFMQGLGGNYDPRSDTPSTAQPIGSALSGPPAPFGGISPMMAGNGITPDMITHINSLPDAGAKPTSFGARLSAAGAAFDNAIMPKAQISGGGGDARQSGNALSQVMQSPSAIARAFLKRRMG